MSGENRIGNHAITGIFRTNAARRLSNEGSAATQAPTAVYSLPETAPAGRLLGLASALAEQGPPIDTGRVAQLKSALADGSYSLDSQQVAASMLNFFGKDR